MHSTSLSWLVKLLINFRWWCGFGTSTLYISTLRRLRVRALDCEMVGVGPRGKRSVLIRVSVVSRQGKAWAFSGKGSLVYGFHGFQLQKLYESVTWSSLCGNRKCCERFPLDILAKQPQQVTLCARSCWTASPCQRRQRLEDLTNAFIVHNQKRFTIRSNFFERTRQKCINTTIKGVFSSIIHGGSKSPLHQLQLPWPLAVLPPRRRWLIGVLPIRVSMPRLSPRSKRDPPSIVAANLTCREVWKVSCGWVWDEGNYMNL